MVIRFPFTTQITLKRPSLVENESNAGYIALRLESWLMQMQMAH